MNIDNILKKVFIIFLLCTLLLSFYFCINKLILKNNDHDDVFNTWQFPMLLAIYLDTIYNL
jgi:hypothetical protein